MSEKNNLIVFSDWIALHLSGGHHFE